MSSLLALSFDAPASPRFALFPARDGGSPKGSPGGWGIAWYPRDEPGAVVVKDPVSSGDDAAARMLRDWSRFRSTLFLAHLEPAPRRVAQVDTHPFLRSHAGRHWLLTHGGFLEPDFARRLSLGRSPAHEPVGRTDSEHVLCWLLGRLRREGCERLADLSWARLHRWLREVDAHGQANLLISDGLDLIAYQDADLHEPLHWTRRRPPHERRVLANGEVEMDLSDARDGNRTGVFVATTPLSEDGWKRFEAGQLLVVRRGAIVWDSAGEATRVRRRELPPQERVEVTSEPAARPALQQAAESTPASGAEAPAPAAPPAAGQPVADAQRTYRISHTTHYAYSTPVERSTHALRIRPVEDRHQLLLSHELELAPRTDPHPYEDVFGNQAEGFDLSDPYDELRITSRSVVRVLADPRRALHSPERRSSIPLVWMPWQRQMMTPYLLPHELPETQLRELFDYAMGFVERQDYDLAETLLDINRTIYQDYAYVQGATTVETTPFDVYATRRGVCQDFANLLICVARLLGVPARYRVGYIHTGSDYANKLQSEASHAWAELYLPWFGWKGFDPTNGCLAELDHIRVACGRNYRDATPTSGTIFRGGGSETLTVAVQVELVDGAG